MTGEPRPVPENPAFTKGAKPLGAALAGIVGMVAAVGLFVQTPAEESGRIVVAAPAADGGVAMRNVAGRQYLAAYLDLVGVATACDGITHGVKLGRRYTEQQCASMLEAALVDSASHVMPCTPGLHQPGHDHQRIAAVLLAHNIGWPRYCRSTVAARFNAGNYAGACDAFLMWNRAGGRVVRGLDNRRRRERATCLLDLPLHHAGEAGGVSIPPQLCVPMQVDPDVSVGTRPQWLPDNFA